MGKFLGRSLLIALGACCFGPAPRASGSPSWWVVEELAPLNPADYWDGGSALGINEAGDVVGQSSSRPVLWRGGQVTDLFAAYPGLGTAQGRARAISDAGVVVGGSASTVFIYKDGGCTFAGADVVTCPNVTWDVYTLAPMSLDINGAGQIGGTANRNPFWVPFQSSSTSFPTRNYILNSPWGDVDLCATRDPQPSGYISCISDAGHLGGYYLDETGEPKHAFLMRDGEWTQVPGLPGSIGTYLLDANSSGVAVGMCFFATAPQVRAFVYSGGETRALHYPTEGNSWAFAINDRGQIVGQYLEPSGSTACMWDGNGTITRLNDLIDPSLGWDLVSANDLNESGEIVGRMGTSSGYRAFRMRPAAPVDADSDGLSDVQEAALGTDPQDPDTDGDGLLDGTEVEMAAGTGCPDPLDADSDGDSLQDGDEVALGTDPCLADTDGDGAPDDLDPSPLEPGATSSQLEEWTLDLAAYVGELPLTLVLAPNRNAAAGRINSLAMRLRAAAQSIATGDLAAAWDLLHSVRARLDGERDPMDWLSDSAAQDDLLREIDALIALIAD